MKKVVIVADGLFRDFVPLSLEKPKALWKVQGEILIERLLRQAKEAKISDITVVLGYKKEMFYYLEKEFDVSFFENKDYWKKDGAELFSSNESCLILSAGEYYLDNPFLNEKAKVTKIDTLDDLRKFDSKYLLYSGSTIIRNIRLVFRCEEDEICNFQFLDRPQTNASITFNIKGEQYLYRHPATGISEFVNWKNEKNSMIIAKELGIDPTYIYADFREGWKIMKFVGPHGKPDYSSFEDSKKIIKVLRKLHSADIVTDYGMKFWEDAEGMLETLNKVDPNAFVPYKSLREKIRILYEKTIDDGVKKCFCHADVYRANLMMMPDDSVILIDWEYAGYSDPGIDVGYYIADAEYDISEAERFIREYLQDDFSDRKLLHFLIYSALIAYYYFIWALNRRAIGEPRDDIEQRYYVFAQKYVDILINRK